MEKALRLQEERAMRPGRGSHQHWYISAAYSFVSIQLDPTRVEIFRHQAVDRVARLLYKVLSMQDPNDEYLASEVSAIFPIDFQHTCAKPISIGDVV